MKKILVWLLIVATLMLCACSSKDAKEASSTPADSAAADGQGIKETVEDYEPLRYGAFPQDYTPEQALEDRCLVLNWQEGAITPEITGMENWEYFLAATEREEKEAMLRIVYFQNGIYYYTDLTYAQGYYSMYTLNEFQNYETAIGAYLYMKRIEGIEANTGNQVCYYVLTDLENLTSEDVLSAARICDIESERGVPYEPIPFTQYLYLDE